MNIRNATLGDILSMMRLSRESSSAAQWTSKQYEDLFSEAAGEQVRRLAIVIETSPDVTSASVGENDDLVGFLIAHHLAPEWELENIVVAPTARRKGIGKQLLDALLAAARETNSESVFLEVRESNTAARTLYERCGFEPAGRRKSYYSNPIEDAILYCLALR